MRVIVIIAVVFALLTVLLFAAYCTVVLRGLRARNAGEVGWMLDAPFERKSGEPNEKTLAYLPHKLQATTKQAPR